jgi:NAD(P)-dependent dehydrogenase (short-subunit alcohol dehydrogenase family)
MPHFSATALSCSFVGMCTVKAIPFRSGDCGLLLRSLGRTWGPLLVCGRQSSLLVEPGASKEPSGRHIGSALFPVLARKNGRIINIASIPSVVDIRSGIGYGLSEGAALMAINTMAGRPRAPGIRTNAIAPRMIKTATSAATRANAETAKGYLDRIPMSASANPMRSSTCCCSRRRRLHLRHGLPPAHQRR